MRAEGRTTRGKGRAVVTGLAALAALCFSAAASAQEPGWADVAPLFAANCTGCHAGPGAAAGLRLDSLEGALAGSAEGPVLIAGDPAGSELLRRLRGESLPAMPLGGAPLPPESIALVEAWVVAGMPAGDAPAAAPEPPPLPAPAEPVTFAHVAPIFAARCDHCHGRGSPMHRPPEGLRLDTYANVIAGGDRVVVLPGNVAASEIVRRVLGLAEPRMPADGPPFLAEAEIELIRRWVEDGARDADGTPAPIPVGGEIRLEGILTAEWAIDGAAFTVDAATEIDDRPQIGEEAEMRGVVTPEGALRATRLRAR